jgi:hypothetical protein
MQRDSSDFSGGKQVDRCCMRWEWIVLCLCIFYYASSFLSVEDSLLPLFLLRNKVLVTHYSKKIKPTTQHDLGKNYVFDPNVELI